MDNSLKTNSNSGKTPLRQGSKSQAPFSPEKPLKPLTRKQKAFVEYALDHPKESYTEAAAQAYSVKSRSVAKSIATENLSKPVIQSHLGIVNDMVEDALITTVKRFKDSDKIEEVKEAMNNARWIHDKIHGKAVQQVQATSVTTTITLDLTGGDAGEVPQEVVRALAA